MDHEASGGLGDAPAAKASELQNREPLGGLVVGTTVRRERCPLGTQDVQLAAEQVQAQGRLVTLHDQSQNRRSGEHEPVYGRAGGGPGGCPQWSLP